jgi:hypothetical protein
MLTLIIMFLRILQKLFNITTPNYNNKMSMDTAYQKWADRWILVKCSPFTTATTPTFTNFKRKREAKNGVLGETRVWER